MVVAHWMARKFSEMVLSQRAKAGRMGLPSGSFLLGTHRVSLEVVLRDAAELTAKLPRPSAEFLQKPPWERTACWTFQKTG